MTSTARGPVPGGGVATKTYRLAYFSPTGTTRRVVRAVASGLGTAPAPELDLTLPESRNAGQSVPPSELLVVGTPVYAGRVPPTAVRRLRRLEGSQTPTVPVVVYGNRHYDDALLELADLLTEAGFIPVAGAAFIGEHSFSRTWAPVAAGRPDQSDIGKAVEFGSQIARKLAAAAFPAHLPKPCLPGNRPFKETGARSTLRLVVDRESCDLCGVCAPGCPVGAIAPDASTDEETCILCCACVRACPNRARELTIWLPGRTPERAGFEQEVRRFSQRFSERREPEVFL